MNIKSLIILLVFLLLGAGAYFYSGSKDEINASDQIGSAIIPGLKSSLNNVDEFTVVAADNQVLSTIRRTETGWVVQEKNDYPADLSKIRATLLNIAEAKIIEEKTSNAELYTKLGVENVSVADAQGVKAIIKTDNKTSELIVGKPGPQINKTRYVRPASSKTSWLVDRKIDLKQQPDYWLRKNILSIEPNEIASVTIVLNDGAILDIANDNHEDNTFKVVNLTDPDSRVIDAELHQVTNALSSFQLLDIGDPAQFKQLEPAMNVTYQLKSGVNIDITAYDLEDDHYMSIDASLNSEQDIDQETKDYVSQLKAKTSGWIYKVPNVTYDSMSKREADILAITEDQLN